MRRNNYFAGIGALLGMMVLILDGKTAVAAGQAGLTLCIQSLIPSLFPFLVLSSILLSSAGNLPFLSGFCKILPISKELTPLLLPAFLGGYPLGAKAVADAYKSRSIPKETAEKLLAFCNHPGPAFLFGVTGALFPHPVWGWALWGIYLLSTILTAWWFSPISAPSHLQWEETAISIPEALQNAVKTMGLICGWVVLFRIFMDIGRRWLFWIFPSELQVILCGLLELTNGCFAAAQIPSLPLRFTLCSGMLAFGGLCVTMQTASVTQGLSLNHYLLGKGIQTVYSLLLCFCLFRGNIWLLIGLVLLLRMLPMKKRSSIFPATHV